MPSQYANMPFYKMAEVLSPKASEHFMVDIFEVSKDEVQTMRLRDLFNRSQEYYGFEPGKYARLSHRNENGSRGPTIMSDTWMEQVSNLEVVRKAKGDVLIGGLGIGMILLAIQDKPEVLSITVVEKEAEVIELVKGQLPLADKVKVVNCNIFDYKPTQEFDTIYLDIWDTITADNVPEMNKLHRRFARKKKKDGWMDSWRSKDCRRHARSGW